MTEPYFGEIQIFGFNFAPYGWAACNGATLPVSQNSALFSLLGVAYGGNGSLTFQLPNLSGRAPGGTGSGPGLTPRAAGSSYGETSHALTVSEMPSHNHTASVYAQRTASLRTAAPAAGSALVSPGTAAPFLANGIPSTSLSPGTITPSGGSQPHENRQPYLGLNFCIALSGVYPQFS
jgi:microcystin-dependent protein